MIRLITLADIKTLIHKIGIKKFFLELITFLEEDFARWEQFEKIPRVAMHAHQGVIELMPTSDGELFSFKYVNGHPYNPKINKLNVVAVGLLADARTGYPLLLSEMTLLTALRTAATSALAAKYLAKKEVNHIGIIGTGAQAEFQVLAQHALFDINSVRYFDIDPNAMNKFENNLMNHPFKCIPCRDAKAVLDHIDIITTATAAKAKTKIIENDWVYAGLHINGIGGDCPGKTELDPTILSRTKTVVEFIPQSKMEGEIQAGDFPIYAELWEIVTGNKTGRVNNNEITLFDSVGFALEDFSVLRLVNKLAAEHHIGTISDLIPELRDPKNLFGECIR